MNKYKIVFFDVDYTLVTPGRFDIKEKDIDKIKELQRNGIYVVLISGRPYPIMKPLWEKIYLNEYGKYIAPAGGNHLYDATKDEELQLGGDRVEFNKEETNLFKQLARDSEIILMDHENDNIFVNNETTSKLFDKLIEYREWTVNKEFMDNSDKYKSLNSLRKFNLLIEKDENRLNDVIAKLEQLRNNFHFEIAILPYDEHYNVEIGIRNKATGAKVLLDHLGIKWEESIAAGDSGNDYCLLEKVGHSILVRTPENGELKLDVDYISIPDNKQNISEAINKVIKFK